MARPDAAAGSLEKGLELVKSGSFKEALKTFEKDGHWFEAAKVAERIKKFNKAIDYYLKSKKPFEAAKVHLIKEEYQKAGELFILAKKYREAAEAQEKWVEKKHKQKRPKEVLQKTSRDLRVAAKDMIVNFAKAGCFSEAAWWLLGMGDQLKAAEYFVKGKEFAFAGKIFEQMDKTLEAGQAWLEAGNSQKAAALFSQGEHFEQAGEVYEKLGDKEAATRSYRRAKVPDRAAKLYLQDKKLDVAAGLFKEAQAYFEAAQCHHKLEQYDEAIESILSMSKSDKSYNKGCLLLIDACIKRDDINFQCDSFIKEFLTNPFTAKTLKLFYGLGRLYEKLELYESAQEIYDKMAKVDENFSDLKERRSFVLNQITGSSTEVRRVLEDDYNYKETSERLVGYKKEGPETSQKDIKSENPAISGNADIFSTSNFSNPEGVAGKEKSASMDSIKPGFMFADRYKIESILGEGSSSIVCKAKDMEIDDILAVKIMKPAKTTDSVWNQFKNEVKLARKLNHPNIVSIYDSGRWGPYRYITMEAVEGPTLKEHIESEGRVAVEEGATTIIQLTKALEAMHQNGIVHRDLKPQNIKLAKDSLLKILDFGLSVDVDGLEGDVVVGSVAYMAPEQLEGASVDMRSDIYSLGVIIYEIFTGQLPFDTKELKGLIHQKLHDEPTPPRSLNPGIPESLEKIILQCMQRSQTDRPINCTDVLKVLYEVAGIEESAAEGKPKQKRVINDRYEVRGEIGRGGMGVVYRAFDQSLQRDVALKFLPHELAASEKDLNHFLNEARSAARLSHTNIVTIYNFENVDKEHFIVMEYIDGLDLRTLLENVEQLPYKSIELICRQVCEALDYAHKNKVFHRDIKSANILWTNDKIVKITDFGLAKIVEGVLAQSTRVQGSPAYMSPEQILGENVDHRTDIYSFGIMLYEMLTGFVPFLKGDIAHHQLHSEPRPATDFREDIPENLATILQKCLKKKVSERFQSATEILKLLG